MRVGPLPVPREDATPEDVLAAPSVGCSSPAARSGGTTRGTPTRSPGWPAAPTVCRWRSSSSVRGWRLCHPPDLLSRVDAQLARAGRTGACAGRSTVPGRRCPTSPGGSGAPLGLRRSGRPRRRRAGVRRRQRAAGGGGRRRAHRPRRRQCRAARPRGRREVDVPAAAQRAPVRRRAAGGGRQADLVRDRHAQWVAAAVGQWLCRADVEPPPGPLRELAAAQDGVLVGLGFLGPREPGRASSRCSSAPQASAGVAGPRRPARPGRAAAPGPGSDAVVTLLRGQLSWERAPGPETLALLTAAADAGRARAARDPRGRARPARPGTGAVRARPGPREGRSARAGRRGVRDPGLLVRATALRAHGTSPADQVLLDRAVELARTRAPGLLLWATGRRLQMWGGQQPAQQAEADIEHLLLGLPLVGASRGTSG